MKNSLCLCLSFLIISLCIRITPVGALAAEESNSSQIIAADRVLYKIQDKLYFASDVKSFYQTAKIFSCVYHSSLLLPGLGMEESFWNAFDGKVEKTLNTEFTVKNLGAPFFDQMLQLIKFYQYIKTQKVAMRDDLSSLVKQSGLGNKCFREDQFDTLMPSLMTLMKMEVFFKSRFGHDAFALSKEEIQNLQRTSPKVSVRDLVQKEKKERADEAIKSFLGNLEKQYPHVSY